MPEECDYLESEVEHVKCLFLAYSRSHKYER